MSRSTPRGLVPSNTMGGVLLGLSLIGLGAWFALNPEAVPERPTPTPHSPFGQPTIPAVPISWGPSTPHPIITRNLTLTRYAADARVKAGAATTTLSLDYRNDTGGRIEGDFVFPVPPGTVFSDFALRDGDKRLKPELLDATQARDYYLEIVRQQIDPGLLEYADSRTYRIRAFPFEPGTTRTIELTFTQQLPMRGAMNVYRLPLEFALPDPRRIRTLQLAQFDAGHLDESLLGDIPPAQFVATLAVEDPQGLGTLTSPTHQVAFTRKGALAAQGSVEGPLTAATPAFELLIGRARDAFALSLLTYPGSTTEEGYFTATIYPKPDPRVPALPKDVVLVLDTSGSMDGHKLQDAIAAGQAVVEGLREKDRLAVYTYSDLVREFWPGLRTADATTRQTAAESLRRLSSGGGTDIDSVLTQAAQLITGSDSTGRATYLLFATDGLPTVGETRIDTILSRVNSALPERVRLFAFGVGSDVNTQLLDGLAANHHGFVQYVGEGQALSEAVSQFYGRVQDPLMTDVRLAWTGLDITEIYPAGTIDLYQGTEIHLAGRYRGTPAARVGLTLAGHAGTASRTVEVASPGAPSLENDFVPRLWANQRLAVLLDETRRQGDNQALIAEIQQLAQRYGLVTPYTSYLVREDLAFDPTAQLRQLQQEQWQNSVGDRAVAGASSTASRKGWTIGGGSGGTNYDSYGYDSSTSRDTFRYSDSPPPTQVNGLTAMDDPPDTYARAEAGNPPALPSGNLVTIGNLTFIQIGTGLVDSRFEHTRPIELLQVAAFGDQYIALLKAHPELASYLSRSGELTLMLAPDIALMIVMLDDQGQPQTHSMLSTLASQPGSQVTASFKEIPGGQLRAVAEALKTGYFRG